LPSGGPLSKFPKRAKLIFTEVSKTASLVDDVKALKALEKMVCVFTARVAERLDEIY